MRSAEVHLPGYSLAERAAFEDTIVDDHDLEVTATLLDLQRHPIGTVPVIDWRLEADRHHFGEKHGPQTRANLTLLDPQNNLDLGDTDPDKQQLPMNRLLRLTYGVSTPLGIVEVDLITGLPWTLQRTDGEIYTEIDDITAMAMGNLWSPLHLPKGMKKTTAINKILQRTGFPRAVLPERKARLPHDITLSRMRHPWAAADRIASSMDIHLFADGRGRPIGRTLPTKAQWHFDEEIVDPLEISTDRSGFANKVVVIGRKSKHGRERPMGIATAPDWHPNSRKNAGMEVVATIHNEHFRTDAECDRKANRVLADKVRLRDDVTASVLFMPHLTPGDVGTLSAPAGERIRTRIDKFEAGSGTPMKLNWISKDDPVHRRQVRR